MAPLTKGGNLPYRRLCLSLGATITMSEMAYARQVKRGSKSELALLRKHPEETCFGVQLAANEGTEGLVAAQRAVDAGAAWVDINCGCPIHDTVKRGLGAQLLQRPGRLVKLVEALVAGLEVPVTVKLRSGWTEAKTNAPDVARMCEEAGVAAITLHPRSREQRYSRAADWDLVAQLVQERAVPVIGNGDILTWYEAEDRKALSGCASLMLGRGVLIKPWLFRELAEGRDWLPTPEERLEVIARFVALLKEHFGDDELGRKRAMRFLPWHLGWFCRYRPTPEADFRSASKEHPLLQTRVNPAEDLSLLEQVLRDPRPDMHNRLADLLWDTTHSDGAGELSTAVLDLAAEFPPELGDVETTKTAQG